MKKTKFESRIRFGNWKKILRRRRRNKKTTQTMKCKDLPIIKSICLSNEQLKLKDKIRRELWRKIQLEKLTKQ